MYMTINNTLLRYFAGVQSNNADFVGLIAEAGAWTQSIHYNSHLQAYTWSSENFSFHSVFTYLLTYYTVQAYTISHFEHILPVNRVTNIKLLQKPMKLRNSNLVYDTHRVYTIHFTDCPF